MSTGSPHLRTDWKPSQHAHIPALWLSSAEVLGLSPVEFRVWAALFVLLRNHGHGRWEGFQSYNRIAAQCSIRRRSAIRAIRSLRLAGLLAARTRWRDFGDMGANLYRLLKPASLREEGEHAEVGRLLELWLEPERPGDRSVLPGRQERREEQRRPEPENSPALELVRSFYVRFHSRHIGAIYRPFPAELALAEEILALGAPRTDDALAFAAARLGSWVPNNFCGLRRGIAAFLDLERHLVAQRAREEEAGRAREAAWEERRKEPEKRELEEEERLRLAREREAAEAAAREERERLLEEIAARQAREALPGLLARLAALEPALAELPPVPELEVDGRARPRYRIAADRLDRVLWRDELEELKRQAAALAAERVTAGAVARLEANLERLSAKIERKRQTLGPSDGGNRTA